MSSEGIIHAKIGEPLVVEIEGAILTIECVPSRSGGKDVRITVENLDPNMGFAYIIKGCDGTKRSSGGSSPQALVEGNGERTPALPD